ncbi:MAG: phenylalanine-4-hydroxylase [Cyclobacteriaceae bacterium]|jgi:phenylalanine-4-hydroxylase
MKQIYEHYSAEDFQVWKLLYDRQILNLPTAASKTYLEGLNQVNFESDRIPAFSETNEILHQLTGWRLAVVPGIVPDYTFFELMSNRRFPATTWLRKMKELDYLEEPDMFHDVFAHVPLLSNQHFVNFLEALSKIGLEYVGNDYAIELLSRIYWFTVEFGLIRESGEIRIYGAGILSSAGETNYCLSDQPEHHEFDVDQMIETSYRKDVFQTQYFIIDSYDQLYHSIPKVRETLKRTLEKRNKESVTA